jgi:hypothetical protein
MMVSSRVVPAVLAAAFVGRVALRLAAGEPAHLQNSYGMYLDMAISFVSGNGLCYGPGDCARRSPLYPLLLSPFVAADAMYPAVVFFQAALGVWLAWIVYQLAYLIHGERAALVALVLAAASPYAMVHDTALQETVLVNVLVAGAILQIVRWWQRPAWTPALIAGVLLGLAPLTTTRVLVLTIAAAGWALVASRHSRERFMTAAAIGLVASVATGMWVTRNWLVEGALTLSTESRAQVWFGNSAWTFKYFPDQSIDLAKWEAMASVEQEYAEARRHGAKAADDFLGRQGFVYIRDHPIETAIGAVRKLWVVMSADLSPSRSWIVEAGYRAVYLSLNLLAAVAMWREPRGRPEHHLLMAVLSAFALTTAIYWAHTSHKTVIDAILFVYAAATISRLVDRRAQE